MSNYVYIQSEPGLWTVGFYNPDDEWIPESDHDNKQEAAERVNYLNGGLGEEAPTREELKIYADLVREVKNAINNN